MLKPITILDLSPEQLKAVEPHLWATDPMGGTMICKAERIPDDNSAFPYVAGTGKARRIMVVCQDSAGASAGADAHNRSVLELVSWVP